MRNGIRSALPLAIAACALATAFAATASAGLVTSPPGTEHTGKVKAESEGHAVFDISSSKIECASTLEGEVNSHGESVTPGIGLSSLSFTSCTGGSQLTVVSAGSLQLHEVGKGNGTVTSSGATLTATLSTIFGHVTCHYATEGTDLGTLTAGSSPTIDLEGILPIHSGGGLCGESVTWTGSYKLTTPTSIQIDTGPGKCHQVAYPDGDYTTKSDCEALKNKEGVGTWFRRF